MFPVHCHGWQIQPNGDSVQETLMRAFSTFLRQEIEVVGAVRTAVSYTHLDVYKRQSGACAVILA